MATEREGPAPLTRAQIRAAEQRADESARTEPRAAAARFDTRAGMVVVELTDGAVVSFPPSRVRGLAGATPEQLGEITVLPFGIGLVWDAIDVDFSTPGLLVEIFGRSTWSRELARKAGNVSSTAKAEAARRNGALGGRPRKAAADPSVIEHSVVTIPTPPAARSTKPPKPPKRRSEVVQLDVARREPPAQRAAAKLSGAAKKSAAKKSTAKKAGAGPKTTRNRKG